MSLRTYLEMLKSTNLLVEVEEKVELQLEITKLLQKNEGKAVLFSSLQGSAFPLLGNLLSSREQLQHILGAKNNLHEIFLKSVLNPIDPEIIESSLSFANDIPVNLLNLPIPKFFNLEGGRYLTSGIVVANFPGTDVPNLSIHRIMIEDENKGVIRLVPRDLFKIYSQNKEQGKNTPIAIINGYHPGLALAASSPLPFNNTEYGVANSLLKNQLKLTKTPKYGIKVPADVEFVFEGKMLANQQLNEGPFIDITGTLDTTRKQPVVEIEKTYHRENPIFQTILSAHQEHYLLMGFPREAKIYDNVSKVVSKVNNVYLSPEGCGWLDAIISISSTKQGDGIKAGRAAFEAHPSLKWCTVVDEDIDVLNSKEVEWARITRTGEGSIEIIDKTRGSSLDPSRNLQDNTSIKVIIDATKKKDRSEDGYTRLI